MNDGYCLAKVFDISTINKIMKHKKSINAKDFIEVSPPRSPPLDLGSSREDVIAHGHHEFLSKIYSKANR